MKNITSIFLSLLTLTISLSPGIAYHFCGGKLAQAKILGYGTPDCGMENNKLDCKNHSPATINKIPCCENEFQKIATDDYQQLLKTFNKVIIDYIHFIPIDFSLLTTCPSLIIIPFYRPPPDLTAVFLPFIQSFII